MSNKDNLKEEETIEIGDTNVKEGQSLDSELEDSKTGSLEGELNFFQKFKTDKKMRAKVELIFYAVIILIVIIAANIVPSNSNYNYTNKNTNTNDTENNSDTDSNLYEKIDDDYQADIVITIINNENTIKREYQIIRATGNSDRIIKKEDNNTLEYIMSDTLEFYNSDNTLIDEEEIFDLVAYKYLSFDNIKKYIAKAIVDYTTKYSSGMELISYKIFLRDILLDNTTDEYITINVTSDKEVLLLEIDYTDLLKNDMIGTCNVKITYTNINSTQDVN